MRFRQCLPALAFIAWAELGGQGITMPLPGARFGITGGVNLARFAGDNLGPIANRTGLVGGISLMTPFSQNFATQVEGLYSMKGMKSLSSTSSASAVFKFDYIEVPLMIRGAPPTARRLRPFGYTGPALNFRIQCSAEATANGRTTTATCEEIEKEFSSGTTFRSFDLGWIFGGGMALDLMGRTFTLGARYELGMRTIATSGDSKNRVLSFIASVESPLPQRTVR